MAYKKFIYKKGKKHGPYYYESYRDGNSIKKRYIGGEGEYAKWIKNKGDKKVEQLVVVPRKILNIGILLFLLSFIVLIFLIGMNFGYFFKVFPLFSTGFSISDNVSESESAILYGSYEGEAITEKFDTPKVDLEIKEPAKFAGEVLTKNQNKRMEFNLTKGNLILYFDLLNYNEFVDSIEGNSKEEVSAGKSNSNMYEEVGQPKEETNAETPENTSEATSEEQTQVPENVEQPVQQPVDKEPSVTESTEIPAESIPGSELAEPETTGGGVTGNTIKSAITGLDISEEDNFSQGSATDTGSVNLEQIQEKVGDLSEDELKTVTDSSVVKAEDFEIEVDNSKLAQEKPEYKWGYNVRLNDLKFMAKIGVTSDENISIYDKNTLRVGNQLLSFSDLENAGYTIGFEKPALEMEVEIPQTETTAEETKTENKGTSQGTQTSENVSEATPSENQENATEEQPAEQPAETPETGITGNIIKNVLGITGNAVGNDEKLVNDKEYENTMTVYIERDFTDNSEGIEVGDIINLDPTLIIIEATKAEHLDSERNLIEDIYPQVSALDDNWSKSINNNEYVRVTFEQNLTNKKDITIYARAVNYSNETNNYAEIEVYRENTNESIAKFENINEAKYYKIYLTNLGEDESYDVFDLKILNNPVEFDYIVDPIVTYVPNGTLNSAWMGTSISSPLTSLSIITTAYNSSQLATVSSDDADYVNQSGAPGPVCSSLTYTASCGGAQPTCANYYTGTTTPKICAWTGSCNPTATCALAPAHQFLMKISENTGSINNISIRVALNYTILTTTYLYAWNYTSSSYKQLASGSCSTKCNLTSTITSISQFVNSSGDLYISAANSVGSGAGLNIFYVEAVVDNNTVVSDTTAPNVTVVYPVNGSFYSLTSINFNLSVVDGTGVSTCWYTLNSGEANYTMSNTTASAFNATNSSIADGTYTAKFYCNDTTNNVNNTEQVAFTIDITKPLISIVYPSNTTYNVNVSALNYTFTETNPGKCWWSNSSGAWNSTAVACGTNWTSLISVEGSNTWAVYINDSAGNLNSSSVTFTKDTITPLLTIFSPLNQTYNTNQILINFTADSYQSLWYYNGSENVSYVTDEILAVPQGNNVFIFYANDSAGNLNSTSVTFFVDSIYPLVSFGAGTDSNGTTVARNNIFVNVSSSDTNDISTFINFDNSLVSWWRMDDYGSDFGKIGNDMIVCGNFNDDCKGNWNLGTGLWSITNGEARYNGDTQDTLSQDIGAVAGTSYEVSFNIKELTGGGANCRLAVAIGGGGGYYFEGTGVKTSTIVSDSYNSKISFTPTQCSGLYSIIIDDVSVREAGNRSKVIIDYTGKNNGSVEGSASQTNAGKLGKGLGLTNTGIVNFYSPVLPVGSNNLTWGGWVKWNSFTDNDNLILQQMPVGEYGYSIFTNGNSLFCFDGYTGSDPAYELEAGIWYQVMCVYSSTQISLYVNGVEWDTEEGTIRSVDNADFSIGNSNFNGTLDDVLVFNRSLSASEVLGLYANQSSRYLTNNFTSLSDGNHTFRAYSQDTAGNVNSTEIRSVTTDTNIPAINIIYPVNGTIYSINVSQLNYTSSGASSCWYSTNSGVTNSSAVSAGTNFTGLSGVNDANTWKVYCNDSANNINSSFVTFYSSYISNCASLTQANTVYTLMNNVTATGDYCLTVSASNITIDMNGKIITKSGDSWWGVSVDGYNYTTIKNGKLYNFGGGIVLTNSYYSVINNITISSIAEDNEGITLSGSSNNVLTNINVSLSSSNVFGIGLASNSNNNSLTNITASFNGGPGIQIEDSSNNILTNIGASSNYDGIYLTVASNNRIIDSQIQGSYYYDVYVDELSPNNTFLNVTYLLSKEYVYDSGGSSLTRKWYYSAYVNDTSGANVSGANVTAYNRTGSYQFNLTTGTDGKTGTAEIIDYINTGGTRNYYSPYNVYALNSTYASLNQSWDVTAQNNTRQNFELVQTNLTACGTLNQANTVYTLMNNLTQAVEGACLDITANNITIDLNGYTIDGFSDYYGVYVDGYNHTIIKNGMIQEFSYGIYLSSSSNNTIQNITLRSMVDNGIYLTLSSGNTIQDIVQTTTGGSGIYIYGSNNNKIINSNFSDNPNQDVEIGSNSINNTFLNCIYGLGEYESVASGSQLIRKWYYTAYVSDTLGNDVSNANVTAYNRTGSYQFNLTTDSNGLTGTAEIIDYISYYENRVYYSPYNVYALNSSYLTMSDSWNVTSQMNTRQTFTLNPDLTAPNITFGEGTETNATTIARNNMFVNVSSSDANNISTFIDFDNSLVSWWRMDDLNSSGGIVDYTGKYNGTASGNAVQANSGKIGKAFSFDGVSSYVQIATSSSLKPLGNITISAWVYPTSTAPSYQTILNKDDANTCDMPYHSYNLDLNTNKVRFVIYNGGLRILTSANSVSAGAWAHVVATYNGSIMNVYINGVKDGNSVSTSGAIDYSTDKNLNLGMAGYCGNAFNGSIDDVIIFNRTLSAGEILALYANTSSKYLTQNFTSLADGSHTFKAYSQDIAGNVNSTELRSVTTDTGIPTQTISSPANITYNSASILFNVSSSEAGIGSIVPNLDNSLVAWWRMDDVNSSGDPTDYMGRNNGTKVNAVQNNSGYLGKSFSFDGDGDYVQAGNVGILGHNSWTTSSWVKFNSVTSPSIQHVLSFGNYNQLNVSGQVLYAQKLQCGGDYNTINYWVPSINTINAEEWHNLICVYNGTAMNTYLDGVYQNSMVYQLTIVDSNPLRIGRMPDWGQWFNGSIDDVMIFNKSLTADEILGLYNATRISHNKTLSGGSHSYTAYSQDRAGNVNSSAVNFGVDTTYPIVNMTYPLNTTYNTNVSALNYTFTELNPNKCWYSTNGGVTNSSAVNCGTNFTGLTSIEGSNTWRVYMNDTTGNMNSSSVTFSKSTIYPLISYSSDTLNDSSRVWQTNIYVNVNVTAVNFKNITFKLYYSNNTIINTTTYTTTIYNINWTGLSAADYKYNVTVYDIAGNKNSTATRSITLIQSQSTLTLNKGWNLIALPMAQTDTGTDRNISLVTGWNLIGYTGNDSFALDNATFTNSSGTESTFATAVANNKLQAYLAYYDSSSSIASQRKYKYASLSDLEMDSNNLTPGMGYWVDANEAGILTLPNVGGTIAGSTYAWSKLRFMNSAGVEKNITEAVSNGWLASGRLLYWSNEDEDLNYAPTYTSILYPQTGYFVYSNQDNITIIRQN